MVQITPVKQILRALCLLGAAFSSLAVDAHIVSSIKPVHLIVREIAKDHFDSSSLLDGSASPHDYSMKVSDAQRLQDADTFVWIGPAMEGFLSKAVERFVDPYNEIRLSNDFDAHPLTVHEGEGETNGYERGNDIIHDDREHSHDDSWHLWLSYQNAGRMAETIASHLINKYPRLSDEIQENLKHFMHRLDEERTLTQQAFIEFNGKTFFAYHDAYQSYIEEFGLQQIESAKLMPGSQLSLKRMMKLKQMAPSSACMLANSEELLQSGNLAIKLDIPLIEVDLLAASDSAQRIGYDFFRYMADIRMSFIKCFKAR